MTHPTAYLRVANTSDAECLLRLFATSSDLPAGLFCEERLLEHERLFPEGQLLLEVEGRDDPVAAARTLVVHGRRDPYRDHSWVGMTDEGWFRNHDPYGDTLYLAALAVHPEHRGRGPDEQLDAQLLDALRDLCRKGNLRRLLVPVALPGYAEHADDMSAEEYARRVEAEELQDPALTPRLSQDLILKRVLRHFRSRPDGEEERVALLEWVNPGFRSRARKDLSVRVSCVQYRLRKLEDFDGFARQVRYFVDVAAGYGADFVLFPELLTAQLMSFIDAKTPLDAIRHLTDYTPQLDELFQGLAAEFQVAIVGGSHPIRVDEDTIENVASLYLPSGTVHRQPKLHITPNEARSWGIAGGSTLQVFHTRKAKVGILICYDVEFPEAARYLADQGAELIFVPFCTDDRQAYLRVRYCAQARAVENQVYVAMAGTVGNLPDAENMDIQYAQSAVLSPSDFPFARDGILVEAGVNTETIITTDIDFEALTEAIHEGSVRPRLDRRRDLFRYECDVEPPA
ncbi:MAG: nitrilase-related carbon-nitrogen hydrolase [Planctomycetota bacterium]